MRGTNGTGANRATKARVSAAVKALGLEDAQRLDDILAQAQADLDEAFEHLESLGAGTLTEGLLGAFVRSTRDLDRFVMLVGLGVNQARNQ